MAEAAGSIGAKTTIKGTIRGAGSVRLVGRLEGRLQIDQAFEVAPGAEAEAEVHARSVRVEGRCRGAVHAHRLSVGASGTVAGEVVVEELHVEEGARLGGRMRMKLDLPSGLETT